MATAIRHRSAENLDRLHDRYYPVLRYLAECHDAQVYWTWDESDNTLSIFVASAWGDVDTPTDADPLASVLDDLPVDIGDFILNQGGDLSRVKTTYFLMPYMARACIELLSCMVRRPPRLPWPWVLELDTYGGIRTSDWGFICDRPYVEPAYGICPEAVRP